MSRKPTFVKKINVVEALQNLNGISYFHKRQLIRDGYIEAVKNPAEKKPGRGRMPHAYITTKKAHNLIRLSANWAKPNATEAASNADDIESAVEAATNEGMANA